MSSKKSPQPTSLPWLRERTILLTVAGSRSYGTHNPETSDLDVKGICIPPKEYLYGFLKHFEQADKPGHMLPFMNLLSPELTGVVQRTKMEGSIYSLQKFMALAADNNPNVLECLFVEEADVLLCTPAGQKLRDNRNLFLSQAAKHRFSGYALRQLARIKSHRHWLLNPMTEQPTRAQFGLKPQMEVDKNQLLAVQAEVSKQLDRWHEGNIEDLEESTKIRVREGFSQLLAELKIASDTRYTSAARSLGFEENFIHYLQKEREFSTATQHWNQYLTWKSERNEERAKLEAKYGFDTKFGSQLVRLLRMCREILTEGVVRVKRPDAAEILAVRNGAWSYEKLLAFAEQQNAELETLLATSPLPRSSDRKALDELCQELVEASFSGPTNGVID